LLCYNCIECTNCYECSNCYLCYNVSYLDYSILNQEYTKEEFEQKMLELGFFLSK
jgi:hypothetical protein